MDASTQTPHTRVVLAVIRELDGRTEAHEVTVVDGACNYVTPTAGALAAASCWWAGSGDNFDVTRSAGAITVRRVEVDEQRDEPLPPATVLRVEVPENAQVQVIVPDTLR